MGYGKKCLNERPFLAPYSEEKFVNVGNQLSLENYRFGDLVRNCHDK